MSRDYFSPRSLHQLDTGDPRLSDRAAIEFGHLATREQFSQLQHSNLPRADQFSQATGRLDG